MRPETVKICACKVSWDVYRSDTFTTREEFNLAWVRHFSQLSASAPQSRAEVAIVYPLMMELRSSRNSRAVLSILSRKICYMYSTERSIVFSKLGPYIGSHALFFPSSSKDIDLTEVLVSIISAQNVPQRSVSLFIFVYPLHIFYIFETFETNSIANIFSYNTHLHTNVLCS